MKLDNYLKIALAILLFGCLLKMPYGYYQLVRLISFFSFSYLAYLTFEEKRTKYTPLFYYMVLAVLFQPFVKIALGRTIWNIVDVIVGIGLLISIFIKPKQSEKK